MIGRSSENKFTVIKNHWMNYKNKGVQMEYFFLTDMSIDCFGPWQVFLVVSKCCIQRHLEVVHWTKISCLFMFLFRWYAVSTLRSVLNPHSSAPKQMHSVIQGCVKSGTKRTLIELKYLVLC